MKILLLLFLSVLQVVSTHSTGNRKDTSTLQFQESLAQRLLSRHPPAVWSVHLLQRHGSEVKPIGDEPRPVHVEVDGPGRAASVLLTTKGNGDKGVHTVTFSCEDDDQERRTGRCYIQTGSMLNDVYFVYRYMTPTGNPTARPGRGRRDPPHHKGTMSQHASAGSGARSSSGVLFQERSAKPQGGQLETRKSHEEDTVLGSVTCSESWSASSVTSSLGDSPPISAAGAEYQLQCVISGLPNGRADTQWIPDGFRLTRERFTRLRSEHPAPLTPTLWLRWGKPLCIIAFLFLILYLLKVGLAYVHRGTAEVEGRDKKKRE